MLSMDVNDDAGILNARVALRFIASVLAPTVIVSVRPSVSPCLGPSARQRRQSFLQPT